MERFETEPRVLRDPEILSGVPVFAGTRVPIDIVLDSLQNGDSWDEVKESYSFLTPAHLLAAISHVRSHGWTPPAPSLGSQLGTPIWSFTVPVTVSVPPTTTICEAVLLPSAVMSADGEQLNQAFKELRELMPRH